MPDGSFEKEIRENQQRQAENQANDEDDGSLVDGLEKVVNPIVDNFDMDGDDAPDDEDIERQRQLNDAAQRPE